MDKHPISSLWEHAVKTFRAPRELSWKDVFALRDAVLSQEFPNPDPRLRPVGRPVGIKDHPHSYLVTAQTFPYLYDDFMAMQKQAGISTKYQLVLTDEIAPYVGRHRIDPGNKDFSHVIYLRLSSLQNFPYERFLTVLGHELGHAWRASHPKSPRINFHQAVPSSVADEFEADLVGICLTGNKQALLEWVRFNGGHGDPEHYPTNEQLIPGVESLTAADCPVPGRLPPVPLFLRRSPQM